MTFALKEFSELKNSFNDTVTILLERDGVDSIDNLPSEDRKKQLNFLTSVLQELERQINDAPQDAREKTKKNSAATFAGALSLIRQDIENNRRVYEGSTLSKRIDVVMDITPTNKPTIEQYADWYERITKFLNCIYNETDSRKGYSPEHCLKKTELDQLVSYMKLSYDLNEKAVNDSNAQRESNGEPITEAREFYFDKVNPAPFVTLPKEWEDLNREFEALILKALGNKNVATVEELDRAPQVKFLMAIKEKLAPFVTLENARGASAIFIGAMLLIRGQIAREYRKDLLTADAIKRSFIHTGLTGILNTQNMSVEDQRVYLTAANHFINYMTRAKREESLSFRSVHLFSGVAKFNLIDLLSSAQAQIKACRLSALDRCIGEYKESIAPPKEKSAGFMAAIGGLFGHRAAAGAADDDDPLDSAEEEAGARAGAGHTAS